MTDAKSPERIWAVFLEHEAGGLPSVHASCSKTKGTAYVRSDIYDALAKERDELRAEVDRLASHAANGWAQYKHWIERYRIAADERDAALARATAAEADAERLAEAGNIVNLVHGSFGAARKGWEAALSTHTQLVNAKEGNE